MASTAVKEFEKYCCNYPQNAEDMRRFIQFAGEIGVLSSTPSGSDVVTLCRAYQEGRRRLFRQLSEQSMEKNRCIQELMDSGVSDKDLLETTCSPIESPVTPSFPRRYSSDPSDISSESLSGAEQTTRAFSPEEKPRQRPRIVEKARSSVERVKRAVTQRQTVKREQEACVNRLVATRRVNRRDAERSCKNIGRK